MMNCFKKFDTAFYCSHFVDEMWIRSTIFKLALKQQYKILLIIEGSPSDDLLMLYKDKGVIVKYGDKIRKKNYRADVLVTASTGIARHDFHPEIKYFCHMPHSLISLHEGYPEEAFDVFDILFACAQHHKTEFESIAAVRKKKTYKIFESGYGKLDILLSEYPNQNLDNKHVLIAPSWGKGNIIETYCAYTITTSLLEEGYTVTLRPHPALVLYQEEKLKPYFEISSPRLKIESLANSKAIFTADHLITDYSGIYFEYNLLKPRKTVFVDSPRKVFNGQHKQYEMEPFELIMRNKIGVIVSDDPQNILSTIYSKNAANKQPEYKDLVYNLGRCGEVVADQLMEVMEVC